jgi:hypothetical protein
VPLEDLVLGLGVESRGRLFEHRVQRLVTHETAGERELLPLALADVDAAMPGRPELLRRPLSVAGSRHSPPTLVAGAPDSDFATAEVAPAVGAPSTSALMSYFLRERKRETPGPILFVRGG